MRKDAPPILWGNELRKSDDWRCASYEIPSPISSFILRIVSSFGYGWEHVSISLPGRTPNWREMCFVKGIFWDEEEVVMQFHPKKSEYIDYHPHCLHLWKPLGYEINTPPRWMIGPYKGWEKDIPKELLDTIQ